MVHKFLETIPSAPEAALAQAKGNPGDKSNEFQTNQGFRNSGCYKDTETRAVPSLEGKKAFWNFKNSWNVEMGGGGAIRVKSKQDKQQKLREATPIVVNMQSAPPI